VREVLAFQIKMIDTRSDSPDDVQGERESSRRSIKQLGLAAGLNSSVEGQMSKISDRARTKIVKMQLAFAAKTAKELYSFDMIPVLVHRGDLHVEVLPGSTQPILWVPPNRLWAPTLKVKVAKASLPSVKRRRTPAQANPPSAEPRGKAALESSLASTGGSLGDILRAALARGAREAAS